MTTFEKVKEMLEELRDQGFVVADTDEELEAAAEMALAVLNS